MLDFCPLRWGLRAGLGCCLAPFPCRRLKVEFVGLVQANMWLIIIISEREHEHTRVIKSGELENQMPCRLEKLTYAPVYAP